MSEFSKNENIEAKSCSTKSIDELFADLGNITLSIFGANKANEEKIEYTEAKKFLNKIGIGDFAGEDSEFNNDPENMSNIEPDLNKILEDLNIFDKADRWIILECSKEAPKKQISSKKFDLKDGFELQGSQLAVFNIMECIDEFGKENVKKLHDELGINTFTTTYDKKLLKRMIKVINKDPEELKRLRYGGATLIVSSAAGYDSAKNSPINTLERLGMEYNSSTGEWGRFSDVNYDETGFSVVCETNFFSHRDKIETDKQAKFLTHMVEFMKERNIPIHNVFFNAHGTSKTDDADGIHKSLYGLTRVIPDAIYDEEKQNKVGWISWDVQGFRDLMASISDGGKIIDGACFAAEIDHETGYSAIGDIVRVASEARGKNDIIVYGVALSRTLTDGHKADLINKETSEAVVAPFGIQHGEFLYEASRYDYDKDGKFFPATTTCAFVENGDVITTETAGVQFKVNPDRKNWRNS
ncbi:MAG: hypothetical protein LBM09_00895 [Candidatus Nomurabacteria bacterium]|jgi:hypothetical protein|nr:hypothetical protein [Candidatus Nomurabacteria bacterium]